MAARWILGDEVADGALILFPGVLWAAAFPLLPEKSAAVGLLAFFAVAIVDAGHVYATLWRTYFRPEERSSSPIYWIAPLAVVAVVTGWFALGLPKVWSFVVYATLFHHFRQYYGMLRWYERLNGRTCRVSEGFLYLLLALPFALMHVRPEPALKDLMLYAKDDIFLAPNEAAWRTGLWLLAAVWAAWAAFEARLLARGVRELNRLLAVLAPAALSAWCFLKGKDAFSMILPLMIAHGVPYFAVVGLSLRRLDRRRFASTAWTLGLLAATAGGFGLLEWGLEEWALDINNAYVSSPIGFWNSLLLAAYLAPLLCHYILDGYIWTGRHREAKLVYARA